MTAIKSTKVMFSNCTNDIEVKLGSWVESKEKQPGEDWKATVYKQWETTEELLPTGHISRMRNGESLVLVYRYFSHTINGIHSTFRGIYKTEDDLKKGSDPYDGDWRDYTIEIKRSGNRLYLK